MCAHICHHPCEQVCKRGVLVDDPMAIRGIKRYLGEKVDYQRPAYPRMHDERIAVIGAGPAGLSAGHFLSSLGYDVTMFEGNTEPGGMLVRAIPAFRLDRSAVRQDIARLEEAGLKIQCSARLGKKQIEALQKEYDAIVVAAGTPHGKEITWVPKWNYDSVYTAIQFMDFVNNDQKVDSNIGYAAFSFEAIDARHHQACLTASLYPLTRRHRQDYSSPAHRPDHPWIWNTARRF